MRAVPTDREIMSFAAGMVNDKKDPLPWLGFLSDENGEYTIPLVTPPMCKLIRAMLTAPAPVDGLADRLLSVPKDVLVTRFDGVSCDTGKWCHEAAVVINQQRADMDLLEARIGARQATIDELMMEYCPDEMTDEQRAEWARHQYQVVPCHDCGAVGDETHEPQCPESAATPPRKP